MERILDVLIAASASSVQSPSDGARQLNLIEEILRTFAPHGETLDQLLSDASDKTIAQLTQTVRRRLGRPLGPAWPSLMSLVGLFVYRRDRAGLIRGLVGLGGHAVTSGIAVIATRAASTPNINPSDLSPANATPDRSQLLSQAIISSLMRAECIDATDPPWLLERFKQGGLSEDELSWISDEFSALTSSLELPVQPRPFEDSVLAYAAVCVVVDRHNSTASRYLDKFSESLGLSAQMRDHLERVAGNFKSIRREP